MNALERLRRRSRRTESESAFHAPFTVDGCESLIDGDFALLRVAGTGSVTPVALIAGLEAFEPLPQPGTDESAGVWRIAFAVPAEVAAGGEPLWLLDGESYRAELRLPGVGPHKSDDEPVAGEPTVDELAAAAAPLVEAAQPVETVKPVEPTPESDTANDPRARKLVEAWSEAADLRQKLSDREEELAEALKELLDARTDVQPLRARVKKLTTELATLGQDLNGSLQATKEARLRATQKSAELDAVRAELAAAEPRVAEAERARDRAEQETAKLRDQMKQLEADLAEARAQVQAAIAETETKLKDVLEESQAARTRIEQEREQAVAEVAAERDRLTEEAKAERDRLAAEAQAELTRLSEEADAERDRLTAEAAEQEKQAEKLRSEIEKLQEPGKSRRRGLRRSDDKELAKVRAELEKQIATQQQRIAELEQEATSFAGRADSAVADSVKEQIAKLEDELKQTQATAEDLRTLLSSERELVAAARTEVKDLKRQLATAKANRETTREPVEPKPKPKAKPVANGNGGDSAAPGSESPPWSALDDELLARIEKAKALTG